MATSAKPRKKYRPKHRLQNPMQYAMESVSPVRNQVSYITDWQIKLHSAMTHLTQGSATKLHMDTVLAGHYICGALIDMGVGTEHKAILICSHVAMADLYIRGDSTKRYVMKAAEMQSLNGMIELHDAMLEEITVDQMEKARKAAMKNLAKFRPAQVYIPN